MKTIENYRFVSILIAARNEEKNILRCLESIDNLQYPKDKLQVLIGNDASEDKTMEIVNHFIGEKKHFTLINVENKINHLRGKANVLAHLAKEAKGDFYFFTDADISVPTTWIEEMLSFAENNVGIVTGFTVVEWNSLWSWLQTMDWLNALSLVHFLSNIGIPVTTMGNNMMIRKEAYWQVGGYEALPFSITEDFELFKNVVAKGWNFKNIFTPKLTAFTLPIEGFIPLLHQRKRWFFGALQTYWAVRILVYLQALFFPFFVLLLIFFPIFGVSLLIFKIILGILICSSKLFALKKGHWLLFFPLFEVHLQIFTFLTLCFHLLPVAVVWKGRKY